VLEVAAATPAGKVHTGLAGNGCSISTENRGPFDPMLLLLMAASGGLFSVRRKARAQRRLPLLAKSTKNHGDK